MKDINSANDIEYINETLIWRYPQLSLPVKEDQSKSDDYISIVKKGIMPQNLTSHFNEKVSLLNFTTPIGTVEVFYFSSRHDFKHFVNAICHKCEPVFIPDTMGAISIIGINNWRKIIDHRTTYELSGNTDWPDEFKRFTMLKSNYQDKIVGVADGYYSNLAPSQTSYSDEEWKKLSLKIRIYHELSHVISRKLFPDNRDVFRDEVLADCIGLISATNDYDPILAKKLLGISDNKYVPGGRLENYNFDNQDIDVIAQKAVFYVEALSDFYKKNEKIDSFDFLLKAEQLQIACKDAIKKVPLYFVEEHNEAYSVWFSAIENKIIPKHSTLIHIDHHDDMEQGGYDYDFSNPVTTKKQADYLVNNVFGIADFIIPALWEQWFSTLVMVKSIFPKEFKLKKKYVNNSEKTVLSIGNAIPFIHNQYLDDPNSPYRFYDYLEGFNSKISISTPCVLDIDLDYFCWDNSLKSAPRKLLEITEEAYTDFNNNPHHPFKIVPRKILKILNIDDKYYIEYKENFTQSKIADESKIIKRVENLCNWLKQNDIYPELINICRSRYSGYTPTSMWKITEDILLEHLQKMYNIEICL